MQNQSKNYYLGALTVGVLGVIITSFILMFMFKGFLSAIQLVLIIILLWFMALALIAVLFLIKKIWDK